MIAKFWLNKLYCPSGLAEISPQKRYFLRSFKCVNSVTVRIFMFNDQLQSRNAAVVMATAQLFHHSAPRPEIQVVAKAMIRLLRSHPEVQVRFYIFENGVLTSFINNLNFLTFLIIGLLRIKGFGSALGDSD